MTATPVISRPLRCVRGSNYRQAMAELTPTLTYAAAYIMRETGKLTGNNIAWIAAQVNLPCKTACEFLEYAELLPSGTWDRLHPSSQAKIRAAAEQYYQRSLTEAATP